MSRNCRPTRRLADRTTRSWDRPRTRPAARQHRPWSVEELGRAAGPLRSALAEHFSRTIGMAPMHYLAQWRMQVAAQKLKDTSASLAQVAQMVGYDSDAAFSRAFKKALMT
jgi:AraC-like DNA-binding protein